MSYPDNRELFERLLAAAPCAVVLPAGCGKTETLSLLAADASIRGRSVIVLTHTNAGVQAIRQRLVNLKVAPDRCLVQTIDSWCFDLVRRRPAFSDLSVPAVPNWDDAKLYHQAALRALRNPVLLGRFTNSFDLLLVDEYQDCMKDQHHIIAWLSRHLTTIIFGDPLQGLFDFGQNDPVDWQADVESAFPPVEVSQVPWRWQSTNPALGEWLLAIRPALIAGHSISLAGSPVRWAKRVDHRSALFACRGVSSSEGSVVALGRFRPDCIPIAFGLGGSFQVMEELQGKTMLAIASVIDAASPSDVAVGVLNFAISCAVGVASVFSTANRDSLRQGRPLSSSRRPQLSPQIQALNALLVDPSHSAVHRAMTELSRLDGFHLYCQEAWEVLLRALQISIVDVSHSVGEAVTKIRNNERAGTRLTGTRQISRPLLVKGLQYDHVVLANADSYTARELYVSLTRGTRSVTVVSSNNVISPLVLRR